MDTQTAKIRAKDAIDEAAHSASADQARGKTKQFVGKIKQTLGNVIGDDELAAEGALQRAEGRKDELKGEIKEKIEDARNTLKAGIDVVKEKLQDVRDRI